MPAAPAAPAASLSPLRAVPQRRARGFAAAARDERSARHGLAERARRDHPPPGPPALARLCRCAVGAASLHGQHDDWAGGRACISAAVGGAACAVRACGERRREQSAGLPCHACAPAAAAARRLLTAARAPPRRARSERVDAVTMTPLEGHGPRSARTKPPVEAAAVIGSALQQVRGCGSA